jgi:tRNA nucleotidyltransferase/poly(A) polymerase
LGQLDFQIEQETWAALRKKIKPLNEISGERLSDEIFKSFSANPLKMSKILEASGAWNVLLPDLGSRHTFLDQGMSASNIRIHKKGEAFALLLLQSEKIFENPVFTFKSDEKIEWQAFYEEILKKINLCFRLSRDDLKSLKILAAAKTYAETWLRLRKGFRYEILSESDGQLLAELLKMFKVDSQAIYEDLQKATQIPENFISGVDVADVPPQKRGEVLKRIFYLQWEGAIQSREEALNSIKSMLKH